tara:strand:+ start:1340 stop:2371 length:1032 start_codon:yes stop_codon:yes gene_type:complete
MIKIGICGLGRVGKSILRHLYDSSEQEIRVVAIKEHNSLSYSNEDYVRNMAYLLRDDSIYGKFPVDVNSEGTKLLIGDDKIPVLLDSYIDQVDWQKFGTDVIIEASGNLKNIQNVKKCLGGSVKKAIITRGTDEADITLVHGVNEGLYDKKQHDIISVSTCTGNAFAPIANFVDNNYGIINGFVSTIHPVLSDEKMLDGSHKVFALGKSFRNIKVVDTSVVKSTVDVLPHLNNKLHVDSVSYRVPTDIVSAVYAVIKLENPPTKKDFEESFEIAINNDLEGIIGSTSGFHGQPFVSSEFLLSKYSGILDMNWLGVMDDLLRLHIWHDNEYGYVTRVIDTLMML